MSKPIAEGHQPSPSWNIVLRIRLKSSLYNDHYLCSWLMSVFSTGKIFFLFFVLQRAFFDFICTVSGCDGGNRTRNIAVYIWRFHINLFTGIMAKQIDGIACHDKAAHSKTKRTRHRTVQATSKAREGGKSPPRGKERRQGKKTEQMCLGGFTR